MSSEVLALECRAVGRTFTDGDLNVPVLRDINLAVARGERIAIVGSSGAGKSTLLHVMGGLDQPTSGEVIIAGQSMNTISEGARSALRNRHLGFVYQFHHLLPEFTALENVAMPLLIRGTEIAEAKRLANEMLSKVGLGKRLGHKPSELSGGERQRAAIARALVTKPACVLADEPTGNLDRHNAEGVYELMLTLNAEVQTSLIVVTHDEELAHRLGKVVRLVDGQMSEESV